MTPRLVVFDLAGTTVRDPGAVNRCFREAMAGAGLDADPAAVDAVMGLPKPEAFRLLIGGRAPGRLGAIHADFVARMIAYYRSDPEVAEIPGIAPLMAELRRAGAKVAVNTGFDRAITATILARMAWPIDASVASDEVARGRPAPEMIHRLMSATGVADPAAVAKVGDAPADLQEGTNAGCGLVIGVTWGSHARAQLEAHPHTHIIDEMGELARTLLGR